MRLPTISKLLGGGLLAVATSFCAPAWADTLHEGDIEIGVSQGVLQAWGAAHVHGADGQAIFEGNLGDLAGGLYSTDDPGYDSAVGSLAAGTELYYTAVGSLSFWNGTSWSAAAVPAGVSLRVNGNLGEETFWTASGISGDTTGLIGQAGSNGKVHEHLDLTVVGSGRTTVGAYLIQLQVGASGYGASDPFYIALNRGLSDAAFEGAVHALTSPVPEPSTWLMTFAGLGAVALVRRQRRVQTQA